MSAHVVVAYMLVSVGVLVSLLCCVGLLAMRDVFDRMHYLGPATIISPLLIAAGILLYSGISQAGIKAVLIAVVLVVTSPVLAHTTARAARIREQGDWRIRPDERVER